MASKAFYRSKKGKHMFPMTDILGRAQRALERGVPIGRGHALEIKQGPGEPTLLPNWYNHDVTTSIRDAMTLYPPMPIPRCMVNQTVVEQNRETPYKEFPIEKLLDKFLKRHPEVAWKVPNTSAKDWAPTLFCRRQWELMQKQGLAEEVAYQQVVLEGGGGGDWFGCQLEHDPLKRVLKKTAAFTENKFSHEGMLDGYSLVREYMRLKEVDANKKTAVSHQTNPRNKKDSTRSEATKFLNEAEEILQEKEEKRRQFDYKILAKMRNVALNLPSQQPSWVEEAFDLKGTRYESYKIKSRIIDQLFAEREAREEAEENGEDYIAPQNLDFEPNFAGEAPAGVAGLEVKPEVFLNNLPPDVTEADIQDHFATVGVTPKRIVLGVDPVTKQSKGFAFALFEDDEELNQALQSNSFQLRGKLVKLRLSVPITKQ